MWKSLWIMWITLRKMISVVDYVNLRCQKRKNTPEAFPLFPGGGFAKNGGRFYLTAKKRPEAASAIGETAGDYTECISRRREKKWIDGGVKMW